MINKEDLPSLKDVQDTAARLKKDHGILTKYPMKSENPQSLINVANFLDMLMARAGNMMEVKKDGVSEEDIKI